MIKSENLNDILFYSLERAIKSYRQFAQRQLVKHGFNITIDQWLVLKTLHDNPEQTQHQVAETIFKDYASVTRIIELLVEKQYLVRTMHAADRRRFSLTLTENAVKLLDNMQPVIDQNRSLALKDINEMQTSQLQQLLNQIIKNTQSDSI
ncbi:MarR family winged helix-turn-helix transcriptional regulator [Mucilaginibacter sp. OK098]|uniref:MarR family winged helix-turn-helix transcriptional regulator n=1 Tax=Mucilaginibacter sp. OK098 TaxID=1855297 RepID=UPI00092096BE|nr:MarR family transcriptional regulator [Mucilaginibacter sp. OK098]SHM91527.1 DNA-binding transcriptional regulator, MarR family [Mucilaginibacter sp. OK098]